MTPSTATRNYRSADSSVPHQYPQCLQDLRPHYLLLGQCRPYNRRCPQSRHACKMTGNFCCPLRRDAACHRRTTAQQSQSQRPSRDTPRLLIVNHHPSPRLRVFYPAGCTATRTVSVYADCRPSGIATRTQIPAVATIATISVKCCSISREARDLSTIGAHVACAYGWLIDRR